MTPKKMLIVLAVVSLCYLILNAPWIFFYFGMHFRDKNYWTSPGCTRVPYGSVVSPDGRLEAKAVHVSCGPVLMGFHSFDDFAITFIKPGDDPSRYVTAMEINLARDDLISVTWKPDMVWKSASDIKITIPDNVPVWIKEPAVAGVNVEVVRVQNIESLRLVP